MAPGAQQQNPAQPAPLPSAVPQEDLAARQAPPDAAPKLAPPPPGQAPQADVDLNAARFKRLGDIQEQTAKEYSQRLDPNQSYKVDTVREDGVVVRGGGHFHKTVGDGATGGYFAGQDGVRYHNTGTTEDGRVLARHSVDRDGNVRMDPSESGPRVYPSEIREVISQLGLTGGQEGKYSRRGYTGTYTLQIEKDGTFSIHYAGGTNASGGTCYAQTYHHGRWDRGRGASLASNNPKEQQEKWAKWFAREEGDATAVSVAHSKPIAASGSGFHSASTSSTVNPEGKLTTTEKPITTAEQQTNIAKISADPGTWSGTYVRITAEQKGQPDIVPPSYSFACQHNGQSGVLNIKQNTLDTAPDLVRMTYGLAVNHNDEVTNGNQGFRSLLTNTSMLLDDGKGTHTVVMLMPNGDVRDVTNNNIFRIQVKEGEPISWVQEAYKAEGTETKKGNDPAPSAAPNLEGETPAATNTPTTTVTPLSDAQKTQALSTNGQRVLELTSTLLDSDSKSVIVPDPSSIIIPASSTADRQAISAAMKVDLELEDGTSKSAYAFSRTISVKDSSPVGGLLFVRAEELTGPTASAEMQIVAKTYEAKLQDNGDIKIEDWHQLDPSTKSRIRSDGSVEVHHTPAGGTHKYSIIAPYNSKDGEGIVWRDKPGELVDGRVMPATTNSTQQTETTTSTTSPSNETTTSTSTAPEKSYTAEQKQKAHDLANAVWTEIAADHGLYKFSSVLKEARDLGLSELMLKSYEELSQNTKHLSIAAHYAAENSSHRDIVAHIESIAAMCEPESKKDLVKATTELYNIIGGVTINEDLVSFALAHRKDWAEIERIFNTNWASYYSGQTTNPTLLNQAFIDELGATSYDYRSVQHIVSKNPSDKFDAQSVGSQMVGMIKGLRIDDNEAAFVDLVEMAAEQGKLKEVNDAVHQSSQGSYTIRSLFESEGFSSEQKSRVLTALGNFNEPPAPYVPPSNTYNQRPIPTGY